MQKTLYTLNSDYIIRRIAVAAVSICIAVFLVTTYLPGEAGDRSARYEEKRKQFKNTATDLRALSIGNSHSLAFHFDSLGLSGMHFWETAADMEETLHKARVVLKHTPSIEYVFIALSPGSLRTSQRVLSRDYSARSVRVRKDLPFTFDWETFSLDDLVAKNVQTYFPINNIQENIYSKFGYTAIESLVSSSEIASCFTPLESKSGEKINISKMEDGILDGYRHALISPDCIPRFANRKAKHTYGRITKTIGKNPDILTENLNRLKNIADLVATAGAQLVIVIPPTTKHSYETNEIQSLIPDFQQAINKIEKHENVLLFDFHDLYFDSVNQHSNPYFYDAGHLAITGSMDFSRKLKNALNINQELLSKNVNK